MIKLKNILEQIQLEAGLDKKSRTGKMPGWDYYVKNNFDPNNIFYIDSDAVMYDDNSKEIAKLSKEEPIQLLSPDTVDLYKGKRVTRFARVKSLAPAEMVGLVNIKHIRKPTTKGGGVTGTKQSKEFGPEKLGLKGKSFSDPYQLKNFIISAVNSVYSNEKFDLIREYAIDCVNAILGGSKLTEIYHKTYTLSKNYSKINEQDINILSKNFGEVLGGLYTLSTNKKAKSITYAEASNTPLYDYYLTTDKETKIYFSVKSRGGSSTSMANLNFLFDKFGKDAQIYKMYPKEFEAIKSLINTKEYNTPKNISRFYETILANKKAPIMDKMNTISKYKLNDFSTESLNLWFESMISTVDKEIFIKTMGELYNTVLADFGRARKTTSTVLGEMYDSKNGEKYDHGYIYYPMGSYVVDYLNNFKVGNRYPYLDALNTLMNYGSFISHVDVNLYPSSISVDISSVRKRFYRFSFNGMSKSLTNRPIGFKEGSSSKEDSLDN